MTSPSSKPQLILAIEALQRGDRAEAVRIMREELRVGPPDGERWRSFARLASQIGEIAFALDGSSRHAATRPVRLDWLLDHCGLLAANGRSEEASRIVASLPEPAVQDASVRHFMGVLAAEKGDFAQAEQHYREAIARNRRSPQSWFALAMIKRFSAEDDDLAEMERLAPEISDMDPQLHARFLYGLAKAHGDVGEQDRAFALYEQGAAIRRKAEPFDAERNYQLADRLISEFTPEAMRMLTPVGNGEMRQCRSIFVNGMPRSGTTLMEQILTSHSQVADGGEINLMRAALIPTVDYSLRGALAYQERVGATGDPWAQVATTYRRLLGERFGSAGRIVDKTLGQSYFMGLMLHALPEALVIWMRRDPEDVALSCFRSFFSSPIPWSWSFDDIAHFMKAEDRLFEHWVRMFPQRILVVPYEELVHEPAKWTDRVLDHVGLPREAAVLDFHENRRSVRTASVQQVRSPISTASIGKAMGLEKHMAAFRDVYFR